MICGISGRARSGKNVFAEFLAEFLFNKTGKTYVLMAYADVLKNMVQKEFDLSWAQLWGEEKEIEDKRYPKPEGQGFWTGREIMQYFGEFYRSIDLNFWTEKLFRIIEGNKYENVIITDVRYPNEVDPIIKKGGYHIRVERPGVESKIHGKTHSSETSLDKPYKVDLTVINHGALKEFRKIVFEATDILLELKKLKED